MSCLSFSFPPCPPSRLMLPLSHVQRNGSAPMGNPDLGDFHVLFGQSHHAILVSERLLAKGAVRARAPPHPGELRFDVPQPRELVPEFQGLGSSCSRRTCISCTARGPAGRRTLAPQARRELRAQARSAPCAHERIGTTLRAPDTSNLRGAGDYPRWRRLPSECIVAVQERLSRKARR